MMQKFPLCCVMFLLAVLGAVNWGLLGILDFNLMETALGAWPLAVRIVYSAIGLAGIWMLIAMAKCGGRCGLCADSASSHRRIF